MAADATDCNFWFHEERIKEFGPIIIFYHLNIKIPVRIALSVRLNNANKYGTA